MFANIVRKIVDAANNRNYHFGFFLALLAAFFLCFEKIAVKLAIDGGISSIQVLFMSKAVHLAMCIPILCCYRSIWRIPKDDRVSLVLFLFTDTAATGMMFWSLSFLPILDVAVLLQTQSIFVITYKSISKKERPRWYDVTICILMILGIIMIAKPEFIFGYKKTILLTNQVIGTLICILCALFSTSKIIFTSRIQETHCLVISTVDTLMMVGFFLVVSASLDRLSVPSGINLLFIALSGVLICLASICIIFSAQIEDITNVFFALSLDIPFSFVLQSAFFNLYPDIYDYCGTFLMLIGVYAVILKNKYTSDNS